MTIMALLTSIPTPNAMPLIVIVLRVKSKAWRTTNVARIDSGTASIMVTVGRQLRRASKIKIAAMSPPHNASWPVEATIFSVRSPWSRAMWNLMSGGISFWICDTCFFTADTASAVFAPDSLITERISPLALFTCPSLRTSLWVSATVAMSLI